MIEVHREGVEAHHQVGQADEAAAAAAGFQGGVVHRGHPGVVGEQHQREVDTRQRHPDRIGRGRVVHVRPVQPREAIDSRCAHYLVVDRAEQRSVTEPQVAVSILEGKVATQGDEVGNRHGQVSRDLARGVRRHRAERRLGPADREGAPGEHLARARVLLDDGRARDTGEVASGQREAPLGVERVAPRREQLQAQVGDRYARLE